MRIIDCIIIIISIAAIVMLIIAFDSSEDAKHKCKLVTGFEYGFTGVSFNGYAKTNNQSGFACFNYDLRDSFFEEVAHLEVGLDPKHFCE